MKQSRMEEILRDYTAGKLDAQQANQELKKMGAPVRLQPGRNEITEAEQQATRVGDTPDQAEGYGLLDTGTGSFDKVQVKDGQLMNCDCGEMAAFVLLEGKYYPVYGTRVALEEGKDGIVDKATDESAEH